MFKFDFQVEGTVGKCPLVDKEITEQKALNDDSSIEWYESEQILPSKEIVENFDIYKLNSIQKDANGINITHMVSGFLLEDIRENGNDLDIKKAEDLHSDLITGVYEGGAKIWECTEDLLQYISEYFINVKWNTLQVLDLGCGSGILGIYSLLKGAKVTFQDYNKDVLEKITIPNVLLNITNLSEYKDDNISSHFTQLERQARFYSGDWSKWAERTKNIENFDIILTSETIYNPQNQKKLINCLHEKLKHNGRAFVAAKTYYFGVGGGLRHFEKLVEEDKRFKYNVVWQSNEGVNREIIELIKIN